MHFATVIKQVRHSYDYTACSLLFSSRRSSRIERREIGERAKNGAKTKKREWGGVKETKLPLSHFLSSPTFRALSHLSTLDSRRSSGGKEETTRSLVLIFFSSHSVPCEQRSLILKRPAFCNETPRVMTCVLWLALCTLSIKKHAAIFTSEAEPRLFLSNCSYKKACILKSSKKTEHKQLKEVMKWQMK